MDSKDIILNIFDSADKMLLNKQPQNAFFEYEQVFPLLSSLNLKGRRADSLGSFAGWTAGFLTGGLGLEDLIIIPLVSRGVSQALGSNSQYIYEVLSMVLLRQINCILDSESLRKNLDKDRVFQKFALLISSTKNKTLFKKYCKNFFPDVFSDNSLDNSDVNYTPYYFLLEEANNISYQNSELFSLLFSYLTLTNDTSELFRKLETNFGRKDYQQDKRKDNSKNHQTNSRQTYKESPNDYYEILGVKRGATKEEIKQAYHEKIPSG
jgi:hypothetical protein